MGTGTGIKLETQAPEHTFPTDVGNCSPTQRNRQAKNKSAAALIPDPQLGSKNKAKANGSEPDKVKPPNHETKIRDLGYLTSREIREISEMSDQEVVRQISLKDSGFFASLNNTLFLKNPRHVRCLVKILYKLVESKEDRAVAPMLAQIFALSSGYEQFIFQVDILIRTMAKERILAVRSENQQFLLHILAIGTFCIDRIPTSVVHSFPVHSIKETVENLLNYGNDEEKALAALVKEECLELSQRFHDYKETAIKSTLSELQTPVEEDEVLLEPPEHFTTLSILPEREEIYQYAKKPFLRANIVQGEYRDWDHYLDVQFRLLREDFVGPLREGISNHLEKPVTKGTEVYVYHGVMIGDPVCLSSEVGFFLFFDVSRLKGVNWENTKRLINGSLLCLSNDGFENILFVTVAERKATDLRKGKVIVKFESSTNVFQLDPQAVYCMAESVAYYEAYRHVLEKLQTVSTLGEADTMPFKQYIVSSDFEHISPPSYLHQMPRQVFNLEGIIEAKSKKVRTTVSLTDLSQWPKADDTDLDSSQMDALKVALTQELSVIQGPPGTGKTYIGIKVVQAFLSNKQSWDPRSSSPILVVCYTNHALDQFLEGICSVRVSGKPPVVTRIGGRCKTEELKNCILYEKVSKAKESRSIPRNIYKPFANTRARVKRYEHCIDSALKCFKDSRNRILKVEHLGSVMSTNHFAQLLSLKQQTMLPLEVWLGLRFLVFNPMQESEEHDDSCNDITSESDEPKINQDDDNEVQRILDDRLVEEPEILNKPEFQNVILSKEELESSNFEKTEEDSEGWQTVQMKKGKREWLIRQHLSGRLPPMSETEAHRVQDIWSLMEQEERWRLYLFWRDRYMQHKWQLLEGLSDEYKDACADLQEAKRAINQHVVKGSHVVGMTTTGAAKHNYIIKSIRPKIVVVEEAAEIFEAHIFTSLSPSVQQLILIGDHQQLRPKPTYFELEKNYKLNVSLFERLEMNKFPIKTLSIQHRMRPEIASLITPSVYPVLYNHKSVEEYSHIQGVDKNLFFISHSVFEVSGYVDSRSHSNPHEAKFVAALCDYFLKQEYEPSKITILTLYRGQFLEIKKQLSNRRLAGVRTSVVDDFQGEENDIILLSLVRSNPKQNIGFVEIKNRICVALSRAKKGLFIIGNVEMLRDHTKSIWPQVISKLESMSCIGDSLLLHCPIHCDQTVKAKSDKDFAKCPEGGCLKKCDTRLSCGHVCRLLCHPYDREHIKYMCYKECPTILDCGHKCTRKCHECKPNCLPCRVEVPKFLKCGHTEMAECSKEIEDIKCSSPCEAILNCGHNCREVCSQPCTKKCREIIPKDLPCGHTINVKCHILEPVCTVPCGVLLDCGHTCPGTCGACHRGRLHVQCTSVCKRPLVCGHECDFPCSSNCPPCIKPCTTLCTHSHCGKMCFEPCEPCREPCNMSCPHHKCSRLCGEICDREPCMEPCTSLLPCGHQCIGLCGDPCPSLCRVCDKDEVTEVFFGTEDDEDARFVLLPDCNDIVEVSALSKYLSMENTGSVQEITVKKCPKCTTPIKRCLRHANSTKRCLQDIETIKLKQFSLLDPKTIRTDFKTFMEAVKMSSNLQFIAEECSVLEARIFPGESKDFILFPEVIRAQLSLLLYIVKVMDIGRPLVSNETFQDRVEGILRNLNILKEYTCHQEYLSKQQISDAEAEVRRLSLISRVTEFQIKLQGNNRKVTDDEQKSIDSLVLKLEESGFNGNDKVTSNNETDAMDFIKTLCKKYQVLDLSEAERLEIVSAIGLSKGHWFKCPSGHFYCIGECGGAMEKAKCPECGVEIGGTQHTLLATNQLAPEMDGARHAAWSEATNMANFDPQELARLQFAD